MRGKVFLLMIVLGLAFAGIASAATVSVDSYKKSCSSCSFDSSGKMDGECWQGIQDGAQLDLAIAYPGMSYQYQWGNGCTPLDQCVAALQSCKALHTSGNDETDCTTNRLMNCFASADACAEAANQICSEGKSEEESGIKDVIKNMTTKSNESQEPEPGKLTPGEEAQLDDLLGCIFPFGIIAFGALGAAIYSRK